MGSLTNLQRIHSCGIQRKNMILPRLIMINFEPNKREIILYSGELESFIPDDVGAGVFSFFGFAFVFYVVWGAEVDFYVGV